MDHYEMVEALRAKAQVTYEEAKAALEKSEWNLLDALVLLESEGKVRGASGCAAGEKAAETRPSARGRAWKGSLSKLGAWIRKMIDLGSKNQFVISRKGNELAALPITVMVLLTILVWPFSLIVLFAGLCLGARYTFRGPDFNASVSGFSGNGQDQAAVTVESQVE